MSAYWEFVVYNDLASIWFYDLIHSSISRAYVSLQQLFHGDLPDLPALHAFGPSPGAGVGTIMDKGPHRQCNMICGLVIACEAKIALIRRTMWRQRAYPTACRASVGPTPNPVPCGEVQTSLEVYTSWI